MNGKGRRSWQVTLQLKTLKCLCMHIEVRIIYSIIASVDNYLSISLVTAL